MIRLRTLGALDLVGSEGRRVSSVLAQPKRFALLSYLAVTAGDGFQRRDSLLALLWPELDQQRGRRSLRQSVYVLRRALGGEVLVSRGDEELGVDPNHLWCDVREFEQLLDRADPAAALQVYGGDFLGGFFVDSAPEFDQWLDTTRAHLRRRAAEAAWTLGEAAAGRGDLAGATDWARMAAGYQPDDEAAAARLISMLDRAGDRAGAVRAYEEFASRLETELGLAPSAQLRERVDAIRTRAASEGIAAERPAEERALPEASWSEAAARAAQTASHRGWIGIAAALVTLAAVLGTGWLLTARAPEGDRGAAELDPNAVAVLPFRVRGAERELAYLSDGMVELISAVLTGEGTLRAVDPGSVLRQAQLVAPGTGGDVPREQALRLGQAVGAGKILVGGIAGTPTQLLANATLVDVRTGVDLAAARAAGIEDSLTRLVDLMTAQLLAGSAGEPPYRVADLLTRSPPALRAYLTGQAAYHDGSYEEAFRHFQRAVQLDSTFGMAAMQASEAAAYTALPEISQRLYRSLAWEARHRMSPRDRAYVVARLGPAFPLPSSQRELLAAAESAAVAVPDRPEVWYILGDLLFHVGRTMGLEHWADRSAGAFRRSLQIDSLFAGASLHLLDLHLLEGDTVAARLLVERQAGVDSAGEPIDYMRWRLAQAVGDSVALGSIRHRFDGLRAGDLWRVWAMSQEAGLDLVDAEQAVLIARGRATTAIAQAAALQWSQILALNRGRPEEAQRISLERGRLAHDQELRLRVLTGLYWEADAAAAAAAADTLAASADAPLVADPMLHFDQFKDICVVGLWRLHAGDPESAARAADRLRNETSDDRAGYADALRTFCAQLLEASIAVEREHADAPARLRELVDVSRQEPPVYPPVLRPANLIIARLLVRTGEPEAALSVIRRRNFFVNNSMSYLSPYLREEGRIAAAVGDTAGALQAYRHYLVLRSDPEPALAGAAADVRSQIARLERSAR